MLGDEMRNTNWSLQRKKEILRKLAASLASSDGIVPSREFDMSNKISRLVKLPTSLGISPVSLASSSDSTVSTERYPISVGIVPTKKCPWRTRKSEHNW